MLSATATAVLSSTLQGEAREVARVHVEIIAKLSPSGHQSPTTCLPALGRRDYGHRPPRSGQGGRDEEFGVAAAIALAGLPNAVVLAAGTDGTDGPTDAAGAVIDGTTAARAAAKGFSLNDHLDRNDSYPLLHAVEDLLKTGSTGTNVMDLNIMIAGEDTNDLAGRF